MDYDFAGCWVNRTPKDFNGGTCTECHCFIEETIDAKTPKYFIKGAFPADAKTRIGEAIATWSAVASDTPGLTTGIEFAETSTESSADVVIEWINRSGSGCGGSTLSFNRIEIDSSINWSFEKDPANIASPNSEFHFLSIMLHEFGHILSLDHTSDNGLMEPSVGVPSVCNAGSQQGQLCDSAQKVIDCTSDGGTCVGACGSSNQYTRYFTGLDGGAVEGVRDGYSIPVSSGLMVLLDRTGSMTVIRASTGNSRCHDALQLAKQDVQSFFTANGKSTNASAAVWTFTDSGPTNLTGGFATETAATAVLNSLTPEGCSGMTPLAEAICGASDALNNAFPLSGSPVNRVLAISSDGGENNSDGECAGPSSSSGPPYSIGSWQRKVSDKVIGQNLVMTRFWGSVTRRVDPETGEDVLPKSISSDFFASLTEQTGGVLQSVDDSDALPSSFYDVGLFRDGFESGDTRAWSLPPTSGGGLSNGVAKTGLSNPAGSSTLFSMSVPENAADLTFTLAGGGGDADLYVRFGSAPSTADYDCRSWNIGNDETCTIPSPQAGTYYVLVRADSNSWNASLTGSFTSCGDTFTATNLSASTGEEIRYTFYVNGCADTATFTTNGANGDADLYVQFGSPPTTLSYDCRGYSGSSNETCTFTPSQAGAYHIMIRAYSTFSGLSFTATYE